MAKFVEKRRNLYYAVWDVPSDCRDGFGGKGRMVQSLGTDSLREAEFRAAVVVAGWKQRCEGLRGEGDKLARRAAFLRHHLLTAKDSDERQIVLSAIGDEADGLDDAPPFAAAEGPSDGPSRDALRFYNLATGKWTQITPLIEPWLASRKVAEKTKDQDRAVLKALARKHPEARAVDRRAALSFAETVLAAGASQQTVDRKLSALRSFWDWLRDRGELPEDTRNPWSKLPVRAAKEEALPRRPFTEEEAVAFLASVDDAADRHPADPLLVRLMASTGARLEEVCSLRSRAVSFAGDVAWVQIEGGKTRAARRRIPVIDPGVVAGLRGRRGEDAEAPIFHEYRPNKYGKVGQAVSNRLGRVLDRIVGDSTVVAAHGWRHRGRTMAERAGIAPATADYFFGHARPGEGLGRYSAGPSDAQLLAVAEAVPLPLPSAARAATADAASSPTCRNRVHTNA